MNSTHCRTIAAGLFLGAVAVSTASSQNGPPPAVEWLTGKAREATLSKPAPWLQLVDRSTLMLGRYRLKAGAKDGQNPHDRDEAYFVVSGKGSFTASGETRKVTAGDLVFVAAKAKHRFHDITEDLDLLVMFSTAVPTTGGMAAKPQPTEQTPFEENSARGSTRIFYWFGPDSAGQVCMNYGRPRWRQPFAQFLNKPAGKRWRCGENFWTTLDTNMDLTIGGVSVPIGQYYVAMQNTKERGLELVLLAPQKVRLRRLDAYEANKTTGGLLVPLTHKKAGLHAGHLRIELSTNANKRDTGTLAITFGGHLLQASVSMKPTRK